MARPPCDGSRPHHHVAGLDQIAIAHAHFADHAAGRAALSDVESTRRAGRISAPEISAAMPTPSPPATRHHREPDDQMQAVSTARPLFVARDGVLPIMICQLRNRIHLIRRAAPPAAHRREPFPWGRTPACGPSRSTAADRPPRSDFGIVMATHHHEHDRRRAPRATPRRASPVVFGHRTHDRRSMRSSAACAADGACRRSAQGKGSRAGVRVGAPPSPIKIVSDSELQS